LLVVFRRRARVGAIVVSSILAFIYTFPKWATRRLARGGDRGRALRLITTHSGSEALWVGSLAGRTIIALPCWSVRARRGQFAIVHNFD
jgi:hypothetical protein